MDIDHFGRWFFLRNGLPLTLYAATLIQTQGTEASTTPGSPGNESSSTLYPTEEARDDKNKIFIIVFCLVGSLLFCAMLFVCSMKASFRHLCKCPCLPKTDKKGGKTMQSDAEVGPPTVFSVPAGLPTVEKTSEMKLMSSAWPGGATMDDVDLEQPTVPSAASTVSKISTGSRSRKAMCLDDIHDLINTTADETSPAPTPKSSPKKFTKKKVKKKHKGKTEKSPQKKKFGMVNNGQMAKSMMGSLRGEPCMPGAFQVDTENLVKTGSVESVASVHSVQSEATQETGNTSEDMSLDDDLAGVENEDFFFSVDMAVSASTEAPVQDETDSTPPPLEIENPEPEVNGDDVKLDSHVVSDKPVPKRRLSETMSSSVIARMLVKRPGTTKTKRLYKRNPTATVNSSSHKAAQRWTALQMAYDELFKEDITSLKII